MSTFTRRGHWRTTPSGDLTWVSEHGVRRDEWDRGSTLIQGVTTSASSAFVYPNASCPVCGDEVFFYQNSSGSKVFFDEIGHPWPKHPCTDNSQFNTLIDEDMDGATAPEPRGLMEVEHILDTSYRYPINETQLAKKVIWLVVGIFATRRGRQVGVFKSMRSGRNRYVLVLGENQRQLKVGNFGSFVDYCFEWIPAGKIKPRSVLVAQLSGHKEFVEFLTMGGDEDVW